MTATITANNGAGTTTPLTVLSPYRSSQTSRNVIHDLIGGGIAVSLVPSRPRAGGLELLYLDEDSAVACLVLHRQPTTYTLEDTDAPSVSMTYVVDGDTEIALVEDTLAHWTVTVGYQEIDTGAVL